MSKDSNKFNAWLKANRWTKVAAARALGITPTHVGNITHGSKPSLSLAKLIEHWTAGEVAVDDWNTP